MLCLNRYILSVMMKKMLGFTQDYLLSKETPYLIRHAWSALLNRYACAALKNVAFSRWITVWVLFRYRSTEMM